MGILFQVDGACLVQLDWFSGGAFTGTLHDVGYPEDGSQITVQKFTLPVHSDDNGGTSGPETDLQILGELHHIQLVLSKYDVAIAAHLEATISDGTPGQSVTPGLLYLQDKKYWKLKLNTQNRPRTYGAVVFKDAIQVNKGTKASRLVCTATAYKDGNGNIWT